MSIFSEFFDSLLGSDSNASGSQNSALDTHPCANCPSNCSIAGDACKVCAPYKKKLIDAVYYVDHLDEFKAQYEVTGLTGASSAITCPYCGAQTQNHQVCEYCGSKLSEDSGKIKVASASDIPNPIMQAQDIIFERYEMVIKQYTAAKKSGDDGIIDNIIDVLTGTIDDDSDSNPMGAKMSEAEIKEAASLYGVSVGEYLTGLDNGNYLTLAGRKAAASSSASTDSFTPIAAGVTGVAGIGAFANYLFNDHSHTYNHRPDYYSRPDRRDDHVRPQNPPRPNAPAPSQRPGASSWQSQPAQRRDPDRRDSSNRRADSRPERRGASSNHHSDRRQSGPGRHH